MRTVAIDFDGVLHRYSKGWNGGKCYDRPTDGALIAVKQLLRDGYDVVVVTARENLYPVEEWLYKWGFPDLEVTNTKIPAIAYIDDRAVEFKGDWNCALRKVGDKTIHDYS
jgi:hypothetical protein